MFGLELWFVLAVVSAIAGGLYIFTAKVAAERDYDVVLFSTVTLCIASLGFLVVTVWIGDYSGITNYVLLCAGINALLYFFVNIQRHVALQCIDTAIYYPLYKTLTPIIAIIGGVLMFKEQFNTIEWVGLVVSICVPLLLITRNEKKRQKDLARGLQLLLVSSILGALAAIAIKAGTEATHNIWLYATVSNFAITGVGVIALLYQRNKKPIRERLRSLKRSDFVWLALWMSVTQFMSFLTLIFAFDLGPLGIVYTVQSLYILIPIVLSIIFYNEHWNARKVVAIILSLAALALLG